MNMQASQLAADLSNPEKRKKGIAAVWHGFYEVWKEPAAIVIQSHWRGHAARKYMYAQRTGRLIKHLPCSHEKTRDCAARVIQRWYRGFAGRQDAYTRQQAVLLIQRFWKGCLARKRLPALKRSWRIRLDAALSFQCCVRAYLAKQVAARLLVSQRLSGWLHQRSLKWLRCTWCPGKAAVTKELLVAELCCKFASLQDCAAGAIQLTWRKWWVEKQDHKHREAERQPRPASGPDEPPPVRIPTPTTSMDDEDVPLMPLQLRPFHQLSPVLSPTSGLQLPTAPGALLDIRNPASDQALADILQSPTQLKAPLMLAPLNLGPGGPRRQSSMTSGCAQLPEFASTSPALALPSSGQTFPRAQSQKVLMDTGPARRLSGDARGSLKSWTSFPQSSSTRSITPIQHNNSNRAVISNRHSSTVGRLLPHRLPVRAQDIKPLTKVDKPREPRGKAQAGNDVRKTASFRLRLEDDITPHIPTQPEVVDRDVRRADIPAHNVIHAQVMAVHRNCKFRGKPSRP